MGADPDSDRELLREAAGNGNVDAVRTMIELGFELSPRGTRTPLHAAAYKGHMEMIRLLVEADADTTLRDPDHDTAPVVHAMHGLQDAAVAFLMDCPMDVFAAAALDRVDHLERALNADPGLVNARLRSVRTGPQESDPRDWATPLWFAAVNGRVGVVRFLLERDADASVTDPEGKSIWENAYEVGHAEVAQAIESVAMK